jgi:hypothetical protein
MSLQGVPAKTCGGKAKVLTSFSLKSELGKSGCVSPNNRRMLSVKERRRSLI